MWYMVVRPGPASQHIAMFGDIPPHAYQWGTEMLPSVEALRADIHSLRQLHSRGTGFSSLLGHLNDLCGSVSPELAT